MPITLDIQKLEPGEEVILYELDATSFNGPHLRFHGYAQSSTITWQEAEFEPWAIEAEGFGRTADGQQPQPHVTVGNIGMDGNGDPVPGLISSICLHYNDLVGARFIRHRTLKKYLDAANFEGGNADADPDEHLPLEIWLVEQKTQEDKDVVQFLLSSPIDFSGRMLPKRQIVANVCPWLWIGGYRGTYCGYTGNAYFDASGDPVIDQAQDVCGGRLTDCKKRFAAEQGLSNLDAAVVNFGGFPSADRLR
ncbi:MAG: phage minor tail protein L [Parvibaculaceae bacterium]|nr:phage minor tail protein L [Parvibaculaceae bacterium]